jgi:hypothetical protein
MPRPGAPGTGPSAGRHRALSGSAPAPSCVVSRRCQEITRLATVVTASGQATRIRRIGAVGGLPLRERVSGDLRRQLARLGPVAATGPGAPAPRSPGHARRPGCGYTGSPGRGRYAVGTPGATCSASCAHRPGSLRLAVSMMRVSTERSPPALMTTIIAGEQLLRAAFGTGADHRAARPPIPGCSAGCCPVRFPPAGWPGAGCDGAGH